MEDKQAGLVESGLSQGIALTNMLKSAVTGDMIHWYILMPK